MTEQKAIKPSLESAVLEFDNIGELNQALKTGRLEFVSAKTYEYLSKYKAEVRRDLLIEFPSKANAYFITDPVGCKPRPYFEGDFYNWTVLFFNEHQSG